ncbi:MAG: hypothetical protein J2P21_27250, partial [Chloracidobacterium sp.]|nr:hypothetical protein [Chloracidobacterium sp.]
KRARAVREEALGPDHPDTGQSVSNLAAIVSSLPIATGGFKKPGFTLSLPDGWIEIPQEVLTSMRDKVVRQATNANVPKYDYGFQLKTAQNWMEHPLVLVQVSNTGRVPEHQLKSLPKMDLNEMLKKYAADLNSLISNVTLGQMQYDETAHVVWLTYRSDVVGVGKVQGISGLIPTEKGYLQFHCSSTESNFQTYLPTFRQIVASVAVSPELAYKHRWSDISPILSGIDWSEVAAKSIGGAIIGGIFALFAVLKRRKKEG